MVKDKIDWKDDLLELLAVAVVVIMSLMFYTYLLENPDIAATVMPTTLGLLMVSFGVFGGIYLLIKHINRKYV